MSLAGKTLFITGGSRGIGLAIARHAAAAAAAAAATLMLVPFPCRFENPSYTSIRNNHWANLEWSTLFIS